MSTTSDDWSRTGAFLGEYSPDATYEVGDSVEADVRVEGRCLLQRTVHGWAIVAFPPGGFEVRRQPFRQPAR
jgi:hypothetical protein